MTKRRSKKTVKRYFCVECLKGWDDSISYQIFPETCKACHLKGPRGLHRRVTISMLSTRAGLKRSLQKYFSHIDRDPARVEYYQDGSFEYCLPRNILEEADRVATLPWVEYEQTDYNPPSALTPDLWTEEEEHELMVGARQLTNGVFFHRY